MHSATCRPDIEVVRFLISNGCDVNAVNDHGRTPLMNASERGYLQIVEELIASGADATLSDCSGWTSLHFAALGAWPQFETHSLVMQRLIDEGVDVNAVDALGWSPAHISTDSCGLKILATAGADLSLCDVDGRTPIHYQGVDGVAELARHKNVDIHARDRFGRTAFHVCTSPDKVCSTALRCFLEIDYMT